MIKPTSLATVLVLAGMVALGPLATSMYLPAFPAMAQSLDVSADQIQLTLSAYVIGLGMAQLMFGPVADRLGRKPVVVTGLALFCLGSIGCILANHIAVLLGYRFLQGFGAAAGMVLAQAIIRDAFEGLEATRRLAYMGSTAALAPAIAPVVGGLLLVWFTWPSIFVLLTLYAAVVLMVVAFNLPESLPPERRQALRAASVLRNYCEVAVNRTFLGNALGLSLMFAGHYGFIAGSPFVLISLLGVSEHHFGWYFMLLTGAFIAGNLMGARLSRRYVPRGLITTGGAMLCASGALLVMLVLANLASPVLIVGVYLIYAIGAGLMIPHLIVGALTPFQHMAGTAAALMGFIQMSAAAVASGLVGHLHEDTARPMVFAIALCGAGALVAYKLVTPRPSVAQLDATLQSSRHEG